MTEISFDTEGVTDCPMNGKATIDECMECIYCKPLGNIVASLSDVRCIYEDVFPELKDLMEAMNV